MACGRGFIESIAVTSSARWRWLRGALSRAAGPFAKTFVFRAMKFKLHFMCQKFVLFLAEPLQQFSVNPVEAAIAENADDIAALRVVCHVRDN